MGGWKFRLSRDTILFSVGCAGALHEIFIYRQGERPSILILCGALMGLPLYLRKNGI